MPRYALKMSEDKFKELLLSKAQEQYRASPDYDVAEEPTIGQWNVKTDEDLYTAWIGLGFNFYEPVKDMAKVLKDLSKVQFDFENYGYESLDSSNGICGFWSTNSGIPVLCWFAGGDWEHPVHFVIYPENETTIRAFIPKYGNTWNIKSKTAFGSEENDEEVDWDNLPSVDVEKFKAEVEKRLQVV